SSTTWSESLQAAMNRDSYGSCRATTVIWESSGRGTQMSFSRTRLIPTTMMNPHRKALKSKLALWAIKLHGHQPRLMTRKIRRKLASARQNRSLPNNADRTATRPAGLPLRWALRSSLHLTQEDETSNLRLT